MADHTTDDTQAPFGLRLRVYWEDTDAGGIVYHANYVKFMERARSDWLRALGLGQRQLREQSGGMFVVTGMSLRYLAPARLDDELLVTAGLQSAGRASLTMLQQVLRIDPRGNVPLCDAQVRIGWVGAETMRPSRIPDYILEKLSS
ncbi:tol-pal system-associated acyl-CoA thioesterase [Corticibacter populi]|uniref:Tol-pal system-associated acyl-CoA thioesterase n=1 Tax=Corticibacter populi TaxID=1550736 RepID=A0A3M6R2E1_9BURK|nr:tol-pal system-associated acyl-CoA thioesterase [Corticibacter populi]RMX08912.1 tol-pal system-associated acyl-CoA thioesterase [Corticibacter populi]RZS35882.1 acyl-CoA thioester hydrolase [Corticibacter populi]